MGPREFIRATKSFRSSDPRFLSFEKNDVIEVFHQGVGGLVRVGFFFSQKIFLITLSAAPTCNLQKKYQEFVNGE